MGRMSWRWWSRTQTQGTRRRTRRKEVRKPLRAQLTFETLEDRTLLSVAAVSLTATGLLSDTAAGNVQGPASVSQDGRYVVYTNSAANLAPGQTMDSKTAYSVFLFDRATGTTTLVSHAFDSTSTTAQGTSKNAVISADGKWIAYVSNSDNLVQGETLSNDTYTLIEDSVTGGTFKLSYGGQTTAGIAYDATPAV